MPVITHPIVSVSWYRLVTVEASRRRISQKSKTTSSFLVSSNILLSVATVKILFGVLANRATNAKFAVL